METQFFKPFKDTDIWDTSMFDTNISSFNSTTEQINSVPIHWWYHTSEKYHYLSFEINITMLYFLFENIQYHHSSVLTLLESNTKVWGCPDYVCSSDSVISVSNAICFLIFFLFPVHKLSSPSLIHRLSYFKTEWTNISKLVHLTCLMSLSHMFVFLKCRLKYSFPIKTPWKVNC